MNICCKAALGEPGMMVNDDTRNMTVDGVNNTLGEVRQLGAWGDYYACGTPWKLVRNLLCEHVPAAHKVKIHKNKNTAYGSDVLYFCAIEDSGHFQTCELKKSSIAQNVVHTIDYRCTDEEIIVESKGELWAIKKKSALPGGDYPFQNIQNITAEKQTIKPEDAFEDIVFRVPFGILKCIIWL